MLHFKLAKDTKSISFLMPMNNVDFASLYPWNKGPLTVVMGITVYRCL